MSSDQMSGNPLAGEGDVVAVNFIIRMAEAGIPLPVTLSVGGTLIAGLVISYTEYLDGVASVVSAGTPHDTAGAQMLDTVARTFNELRTGVLSAISEEEDSSRPMIRHYIHLKNAHVVDTSGSALPSNSGTYWRIKLDAVDGYMLGTPNFGT